MKTYPWDILVIIRKMIHVHGKWNASLSINFWMSYSSKTLFIFSEPVGNAKEFLTTWILAWINLTLNSLDSNIFMLCRCLDIHGRGVSGCCIQRCLI